jgi:hypothetical protein
MDAKPFADECKPCSDGCTPFAGRRKALADGFEPLQWTSELASKAISEPNQSTVTNPSYRSWTLWGSIE